ncbi:hypothetical protein NHH03_04220 [Stieleria sp. TO1_6]|uniref:hypothetical protein n=1 Tax=Stieleria tagensis TaxID=2956795 RepID=UPI00209BA736|nr:hypothetical protein [Stieleria tagensis]MCO8120932.1 hypothetical protein [Stieleria tagensis]
MSDQTKRTKATLAAFLAAGSLVAGGCTSPATQTDKKIGKFFDAPEWTKPASWRKSKDELPEPYPNPVKLAATWTPDTLVQSGRVPTRGFGGRLFFFDEKTKVVPVEGTLTIHGFEADSEGKEGKIQPFKFTPEQFTQHVSQSDFGASYSIWIPWDAVGSEKKRVSLVATFQTTEGKLVQGSPTTVILPGNSPEEEPSMVQTPYSPQYQGHRDAIAHHTTRASGLATTTIRRNIPSPESPQREPSVSIEDRINAIAAAQQVSTDGSTPFIDVPLTPKTPTVMAASAQMPVKMDKPSVPRRISSPETNVQR